jgi:hypothetical protein
MVNGNISKISSTWTTDTDKSLVFWILGGVWLEELKFNKHYSTFVLFNKKFVILD